VDGEQRQTRDDWEREKASEGLFSHRDQKGSTAARTKKVQERCCVVGSWPGLGVRLPQGTGVEGCRCGREGREKRKTKGVAALCVVEREWDGG